MDKFVIKGGIPLEGEIRVNGAKNSALPVLAASLLTGGPVVLRGIPNVRDVLTMAQLVRNIGADMDMSTGALRIAARRIQSPEAPYELVKTMRASSLVLGPLLARCGRARVSLPGGCAIGARPINLHLAGLENLGAQIRQEHGYVEAVAPDGLHGTYFTFDRITVTGTEDLMMAAVLARGETVLENAAREPEVVDLAALLTKMGAQIEGAGTSRIRIQGVEKLGGAEHTIIPDRIEAGTFMAAAAITKGDVRITNCVPEHLMAFIMKLRQAGVEIEDEGNAVRVRRPGPLRAVDAKTEEHPGFATDLQAQYMALMTQAEGTCVITETIFENRFMHALELMRMGANIRLEGRHAVVEGPSQLTGASVQASDLRASASLVIAGLVASGETVIDRVYHIDRGYEKIEQRLRSLGARIERVQ